MNTFIVAIKDTAIDGFNNPFFVPHVGLAERHFMDEVKNPESPIYKHPDDYFLYLLGTFDTDTGEFVTHPPKQLARGADFVSST